MIADVVKTTSENIFKNYVLINSQYKKINKNDKFFYFLYENHLTFFCHSININPFLYYNDDTINNDDI